MDLHSWINSVSGGYAHVLYVFLIIFFTLLISYIENKYYKFIVLKLEKSHRVWELAVVNALFRPLNYLIWFLGLQSLLPSGLNLHGSHCPHRELHFYRCAPAAYSALIPGCIR